MQRTYRPNREYAMSTSEFAADMDVYVKMAGGILTYHASDFCWVVAVPCKSGKVMSTRIPEYCSRDLALMELAALVGAAQET